MQKSPKKGKIPLSEAGGTDLRTATLGSDLLTDETDLPSGVVGTDLQNETGGNDLLTGIDVIAILGILIRAVVTAESVPLIDLVEPVVEMHLMSEIVGTKTGGVGDGIDRQSAVVGIGEIGIQIVAARMTAIAGTESADGEMGKLPKRNLQSLANHLRILLKRKQSWRNKG